MQRRKFSREFKLEAVKLVRERGVSAAQAARDLDLHENVLRKWVREFATDPQEAFPDDETMRISHEAIYQSIYVQGRGALRRELAACLRSGRALRVPRARAKGRGKSFVSPEILISERPSEVADRAVPGHWEGDLILGLGSGGSYGDFPVHRRLVQFRPTPFRLRILSPPSTTKGAPPKC